MLLFICSPTEKKPPIAARTRKKSADDKSSYAEHEFKRQGVRAPWEMLKTNDALPPRALTVTSVTQSHDLQVPPPPYQHLLPFPVLLSLTIAFRFHWLKFEFHVKILSYICESCGFQGQIEAQDWGDCGGLITIYAVPKEDLKDSGELKQSKRSCIYHYCINSIQECSNHVNLVQNSIVNCFNIEEAIRE